MPEVPFNLSAFLAGELRMEKEKVIAGDLSDGTNFGLNAIEKHRKKIAPNNTNGFPPSTNQQHEFSRVSVD